MGDVADGDRDTDDHFSVMVKVKERVRFALRALRRPLGQLAGPTAAG